MPLSDLSNNYTQTPSKICCIPGCHSTEVTPSVTMYKVPSGKLNSRYGKYLDGEKWSTDFFEVILKFRNPKENNFFQRLQNGKAFICNVHFNENDIVKTNQLSWLKFGVLPKKCLPLPEGAGESLLPPKRPKLIGNILSAEQHHDCHPSSDFSMQNSISNLEKIEKQFRLSSLKDTWTIIKHSSEVQLNQALQFTFWTLEHAKYGFPKYSVLVHSDLSFIVSICCTVIPLNHEIYALNLNGSSIIDLLNCVFKLHMCNGFVEVTGPKWHPILPVPSGNNCNGESSSKIKYISLKCKIAVSAASKPCLSCINQYHLHTIAQERKESLKCTPAISTNNCSVERLKFTAFDQRKRIQTLQNELKTNGVAINQQMSEVVNGITEKERSKSVLLRDWVSVQSQNISVPKYQRRYPPSVLRYCLQLYAKSPAAYKLLGDLLVLPSPSRLRMERNKSGPVQMGVQEDLLQRLMNVSLNEQEVHKRKIALLMDEMTIKEDLVYRRYSNDVIGYCSNGKIADHMLMFYTRGITNPKLDGVLAYFPTRALKYEELYTMVMKVILQIEMKTTAEVSALIADGLSANTTLFDVLAQDEEDDGVKYRMKNPKDASRYVYFIQDPPHLLKCVRNNLLNPKKNLWNDGYFQWHPIRKLIEDDLALGELRLFPKLSEKHAFPNAWEKMNVRIAAQTLSCTVGLALRSEGHEGLGNFVLLVDKWFDMMNTSSYHARRKAKPDMEPFKKDDSHSQQRLDWLEKSFIGYMNDWKRKVAERSLPSCSSTTPINRSLMLLSKPTMHGLLMTTKSMVDLIRVMLDSGASFVTTRRLNQDPVESHFGHQRQKGRYSDAPNALMFGYNVRSINCFRSAVPEPVMGSNVSEDYTKS